MLLKTELEAEDRVRVTVRDTGVGFDPQDTDKLFAAFYSTKSSGMGIGLSVSRCIIESRSGSYVFVLYPPNTARAAPCEYGESNAHLQAAAAAPALRN